MSPCGGHIFIYLNGEGVSIAGTSCVAPLWAGLAALANQQATGYSLGPVGFLNPVLYTLGEGSFHGITTGGNEWSQSPSDLPPLLATIFAPGWDAQGERSDQYSHNHVSVDSRVTVTQ